MAGADVTVVGGGVFGLAIAYVCALRGARVRLIERTGIGAGASGGLVGALAPHVPGQWNPKKAFQLDSLLQGQSFWRGVAERSGLSPGYARLGRLQLLSDAAAVALAQERAGQAAVLWQGRAVWEVVPCAGKGQVQSRSGWLVRDDLSARVQPRRACAALAAAILALGGRIERAEAVPGQVSGLGGGPVIWATGVQGLADLSASVGRSMGGAVKGQALALGFEAVNLPQVYADGLHIVPQDDGTVAIGSTSERDYASPDATDAQLDLLHARAVAVWPALQGAPVVARWAGLRPRAASRAPMLGAWPGRPGNFVANGGFKIGFGMAPKVAEVMADLVLDGHGDIPDGFRVEDNF